MDPQHRILVVDDDRYIRELMSEVLGLLGHHVSTACDGQTGLETLDVLRQSGGAPDVIFVDQHMPGGDGVGFCFGLRERGCTISTVLMSGEHTEGRRLQRDLHLSGFLAKPFSITDLLECVECQLVRGC